MNNERRIDRIITYIVLIALLITSSAAGIFGSLYFYKSYRLEQTRSELNNVREQLQLANDRQSEINRIVERTGTILCESAVTISDIRRQIQEIRESYEDMERILYNSGNIGDSDSDHMHNEEQN